VQGLTLISGYRLQGGPSGGSSSEVCSPHALKPNISHLTFVYHVAGKHPNYDESGVFSKNFNKISYKLQTECGKGSF